MEDLNNTKYRNSVHFEQVKAALITAARYQGVITYQDVAAIMGLPLTGNLMGKETGQMLGEISEVEVAAGRPMLSAIAVNTEGKPGGGFPDWARRLGRLAEGENWETLWKREVKEVYRVGAPTRG